MTTAAICATREVSCRPSFYRGEQYDPDLGLYYLRARYYNPATGRFMSRDPWSGNQFDPKTLHKYLYASGDPINISDPTGRMGVAQYASVVVVIALVPTYIIGVKIDRCLEYIFYQIKDKLSSTFKNEPSNNISFACLWPSIWGVFYNTPAPQL